MQRALALFCRKQSRTGAYCLIKNASASERESIMNMYQVQFPINKDCKWGFCRCIFEWSHNIDSVTGFGSFACHLLSERLYTSISPSHYGATFIQAGCLVYTYYVGRSRNMHSTIGLFNHRSIRWQWRLKVLSTSHTVLNAGANFSEIIINLQQFTCNKTNVKISTAKWRLFCAGLEMVFNHDTVKCIFRN